MGLLSKSKNQKSHSMELNSFSGLKCRKSMQISSKYIMQLKIYFKLQENGLWELEYFGLFLFDWVTNDIMTEIINENSVNILDLINHSTKTNTIERFIVIKNGSNNIMWNWTRLKLYESIALNIISPLLKMKMLKRIKSRIKRASLVELRQMQQNWDCFYSSVQYKVNVMCKFFNLSHKIVHFPWILFQREVFLPRLCANVAM